MAPIADTSLADFTSMLTLNAQTCFLCCREAVKSMRKHGDGGRIVNVAARPAVEPTAGMTAYAASKGAIAAMTRGLAAELAAERILVNAIVPSIIDTPTNRKAMPDGDFDRWPKADEIAEIILFLISPANRLTHGALVPVYGSM
jgi:NAD(P)-dependent dehydrogenase (short-subunit alcohol dehydrogenase family)